MRWFFPFLASIPLFAGDYAIMISRIGAGLFSSFADVLAAVNAYDKGLIDGLEVAFGSEGVYYEEGRGSNWWEYYCEPIRLGAKKDRCSVCIYDCIPNVPLREFYSGRHEPFHLIQKYIRIKQEILDEVESFYKEAFEGKFVIGVHYRGTDWIWENQYTRIPYETFAETVNRKIEGRGDYRIFVATDEQQFLDFMEARYPGRILCQKNAHRTYTQYPLHKDSSYSRSLQGREALIDCLLLSKTDRFVGSSSNLSQWVGLFNPDLDTTDLSIRRR